jgi:serine/threonine protein kinase
MEKTVLENEKTVIDNDITIIENNDITILENKISTTNINNIAINSYFKDFKIIKQLPTTGAEADVYLIKKNNNKYILKLYRHGIELEKDKIKKILDLSKKYPEDIVQIFEIDKDKNLNRWYEIQEYAEYGTLQDIIKNNNEFAKQHIKEIIKEMTLLLQSIHKENVIHRDIKPQNILVRTLEPVSYTHLTLPTIA